MEKYSGVSPDSFLHFTRSEQEADQIIEHMRIKAGFEDLSYAVPSWGRYDKHVIETSLEDGGPVTRTHAVLFTPKQAPDLIGPPGKIPNQGLWGGDIELATAEKLSFEDAKAMLNGSEMKAAMKLAEKRRKAILDGVRITDDRLHRRFTI